MNKFNKFFDNNKITDHMTKFHNGNSNQNH